MLGTRFDFTLHRGDARQLPFVVKDQAGDPVDLTDASLTWVLADRDTSVKEAQPEEDSVRVTKTEADDISVTDATNGVGRIYIESEDTDGLAAPLNYYHELQVELVSGDPYTVMYGLVQLKRDAASPGPSTP